MTKGASVAVTTVPVVAEALTPGDPFRRRLLDGLTRSIVERGYRDTTVADIVRHARTSKRTFYSEFGSKDDCLLELFDADNAAMIADIRGSVDPEAHWQTQVRQAVNAYARILDAQPAVSLCWIRELPALGEAARPVQRRSMRRLTEMLVELSVSPGFQRAGIAPMSERMALILLGGVRELSAHTMEDGGNIGGITDTAVAAVIALAGSGRTDVAP